MQTFRDTDGNLYAIRLWRFVFYVNHGPASLRYGGIVTQIGLADFIVWRISAVGFPRLAKISYIVRQLEAYLVCYFWPAIKNL